jgi:hypothetical protein
MAYEYPSPGEPWNLDQYRWAVDAAYRRRTGAATLLPGGFPRDD